MSSEVPEDRCGYQTDYENTSASPKNICCCRPTWRETKRCIWHADVTTKPPSELKKRQKENARRFDGTVLRRTFITNLDLSECTLFEVDFSDSSLHRIDLSGSKIQNSDFSNSKLTEIELFDGEINRCDFSGSNIGEAEIRDSILFRVDFSNSELRMVDISRVDGDEVDFSGTGFKWSNITNSRIEYADFQRASITNIDFSGSQFQRGMFRDAEIQGSRFEDTDVSKSNFNGSDLESVDFTNADAKRTIFDGANLEEATFDRTELRDADFKHTRLYQTLFSDTRINSNTDFGDESAYEKPDTVVGGKYENTSRLEAAAWVYRRLEDLHEENAMSEKAREYHIRKEEAKRRGYREDGEWFKWGVHTANYHLTEHGENLWQVAKWSGITIGAGTVLYPLLGGLANAEGTHNLWSLSDPSAWDVGLLFARSLYFSTVTFTTLGYGDYHPVGPWAKALAGVESLAGALLVALFVFVLGRRVAR